MRAIANLLVLAIILVAGPMVAHSITWVPNAWESTWIDLQPLFPIEAFTVPLPSALRGKTYNLALMDFSLYDAYNSKYCGSALLTIQGASNQAILINATGTFYLGAEFQFQGNAASSYDATERQMQPCNNMGGGGHQVTQWHAPSGSTVQFNLSQVEYIRPPLYAQFTTNWELEFQLT